MKQNRNTTMILFFLLTISIIIFISRIREICSVMESIDQRRTLLNKIHAVSPDYLSQLGNQAWDLKNRGAAGDGGETMGQQSPEDRIGMIRDLLRTHNIGIERFRTGGKEGTGTAEFTFNCDPVNFFNFLKEESGFPLTLNYISIKPVQSFSTINVTVRFSHVS